jgi:esterase/lipase superfamily enzyme
MLIELSGTQRRDYNRDVRVRSLAAPDLDMDIVRPRLMAEKFDPAIGQITIYTTQADRTLSAFQTLMSGTRFGRVQQSDLGEREQRIFTEVTNLNLIEVQGVSGVIRHGYFRCSGSSVAESKQVRFVNLRLPLWANLHSV